MTAYQVVVAREGDCWLAHIPSLEGARTEARSLHGLDREVREVIALVEDLPEGAEQALELNWVIAGAAPEVQKAFALRQQRRDLAQKQADVEAATREVVAKLSAAGWSRRDQALMLGLTYGRISQLDLAAT